MTYTQKRLEEFDEKFLIPPTYEEARDFLAESIDQAIAEERKRVMEEIEKQIAIHNQLEEEWTGISLAYILKKTINPHAERKEELQILLSSIDKPKCVCGEQDIIGGAEVEIGGVCHRPKNPCYIIK